MSDDVALDLDEVTKQLVVEGVKSFSDSFDQLLNAVAAKRVQILGRAA